MQFPCEFVSNTPHLRSSCLSKCRELVSFCQEGCLRFQSYQCLYQPYLPNPVVDKYPTLFLLPTDPCFIMSHSSSNARAIIVSALTAAIISTTAVFLRLLSKYWTKKPGVKADDYWIMFATLSFWAYVSLTFWCRCL